MEKLPIFKPNDVKSFKFSIEQYINLEIEYNRYTLYKDLVKCIENIFKLYDDTKKLYENKNIIDRFILECINHGISPIQNISDIDTGIDTGIHSGINISSKILCNIENIENIELLGNNIFFNKCLNNIEDLRDCVFFKKMINEYIEKKIKITQEHINKLEKCIICTQHKFINLNKLLFLNKHKYANICTRGAQQSINTYKLSAFADISCSIYVSENDNYIIKYRNYTKMINYKRYSKLIKNYDRPFPYDIIKMILRYAIFDTSNQQWSIGINLYENISYLFDISFEMFASPLNFNMNMFCSIFLDTDKIFGSIGSFYNLSIECLLNQNIKGVFYNPPYLPILMNHTTKICLNLLAQMDKENIDFTIVSFLPNWTDADYIQLFLQSQYVVVYKIVNKGDYILHEKDKGKLIKGTFELLVIIMNSKKHTWNTEKIENVNKNFKDIIKIMKDETRIGVPL